MDALKIAQGEIIYQTYENHEQVKTLLNLLHDYYDLSWPKIADLPEINPPGAEKIPFSTLANIAHTGKVPQKWRERFPGVGAIDSRPRTMIHLENMASTAQTLYNFLSPSKRLELIRILASQPDIIRILEDQPDLTELMIIIKKESS